MIFLQRLIPCGAVVVSLLSVGAAAHAATWAAGRTSPSLREVIAIDATGEPGWPYGAEDVAGDGATFGAAEQAIDVRTAYAAADTRAFWVRVYVSGTQAPGANLRGFVFIDSDHVATTGGTAKAPEIDPKFTSDPSPGGYEWVLEIGDDRAGLQLWSWQGTQYATVSRPAPRVTGEVGTDTDPIRLGGASHGYIQSSVDLGEVGLAGRPCDANLYVRTVNDTAALGDGDLDVGQADRCVAADANGNGVPDIVVPPGCTKDADCPAGGICQAGKCLLAAACATDADCGAGMQCTADGRCVPAPTGTCATTADCNGLVCQNRKCAACTATNQCGTGQVCAPDGHCIADQGTGGGVTGAGGAGLTLAPGEEVKGGACHCTLSRRSGPRAAPVLWLAGVALLWSRRRRSSRRP